MIYTVKRMVLNQVVGVIVVYMGLEFQSIFCLFFLIYFLFLELTLVCSRVRVRVTVSNMQLYFRD